MLSIILILFIALAIPGIIARTRAILSGRRGVKFLQHINNVEVMFGKGVVYGSLTGFVFRIAPLVYLAAVVTAMLCVPVGGLPAVFSFDGDVILFCFMLTLSRTVLLLAAMDTGSSIGGMGASREALYGAFVEPGLFVIFGTLALASGHTSFADIFYSSNTGTEMFVGMILLGYCMFREIIVEAGRMPVADSGTHLELTMIHEAMILDYCGFDLGLITVAGWIKTAALTVIGASAIAAAMNYDVVTVMIVSLAFAVAIGVMESFIGRNKLTRNPAYIITTIAVALLGYMIIFIIRQGIDIS